MMDTNTPSITFYTPHPAPPAIEDIVAYLEAHGYHLKRLEPDVLPDSIPDSDVFMTIDPDPGTSLVNQLRNEGGPKLRPLIVVLTDDQLDNHVYDWADIVLPPIPYYIDYQLRTVLRLRRENAELREKLENQQRDSDEIELLKNAIVRNVSHELKTPLLQVKSAVSLLAEDVSNDELIKYASEATARLEALVKHITLLGSSLDPHPGPVIVRDAIEYARRNIRRIWERRDQTDRISAYVEAGLPPVLADKVGLSTALQLLIDNALKFSKGPVEVRAVRDEESICFSVCDRGIGIAPNQLDLIFDSFYQVDNSSTRSYGGTGVGLAIVRVILERHNARINVSSEIGTGSTFSFKLPAVDLD